eukprot:CAMPEP_0174313688 /NCGR_PEP_ID=MMETSP0810-20121108/5157_1 /TAXON_ID=73025 ORGANISM="Eutreptiella gymnastica-like, Strain CCMP1594" /NCGR_SAMPLE_ID=MMETSP0810 /ASSEMBLY_ACC=CAM_ASM_000659 /LENGTH=205 /DNA_ID=CAMNT_0015422565 /DNA_START=1317 /DNA_END=1934 /DNA_ORIENTATION=+
MFFSGRPQRKWWSGHGSQDPALRLQAGAVAAQGGEDVRTGTQTRKAVQTAVHAEEGWSQTRAFGGCDRRCLPTGRPPHGKETQTPTHHPSHPFERSPSGNAALDDGIPNAQPHRSPDAAPLCLPRPVAHQRPRGRLQLRGQACCAAHPAILRNAHCTVQQKSAQIKMGLLSTLFSEKVRDMLSGRQRGDVLHARDTQESCDLRLV